MSSFQHPGIGALHERIVEKYGMGHIEVLDIGDENSWLLSVDESCPPIITFANPSGYTAVLSSHELLFSDSLKRTPTTDARTARVALELMQLALG